MDFQYQRPLLLSEAVVFARPYLEGARSAANTPEIRMEFCMNIAALFARIMDPSIILSPTEDDNSAIGNEMWDIVRENNRIMRKLKQQHGKQISTSSSGSIHAASSVRSMDSQDLQSARCKDAHSHSSARPNGARDHKFNNKTAHHQAAASRSTSHWSDESNTGGGSGSDSWQEHDFDSSDQESDYEGFSLTRRADLLSNNIEKTLAKIRSSRLKDHGGKVYIKLRAKLSLQDRDDNLFSLQDKVDDFLRSDCKVMLLLGDSGGGKSMFLRELEVSLWKKYGQGCRIPLLIDLPDVDTPEEELVDKQLRVLGFNPEDISELKERSRFTLLCDGYDESKCKKNLYVSNRLNGRDAGWNAKMVIACRSTYLGHEYRALFQPLPAHHYSPLPADLFQEVVIAPFSTPQIKDYVTEYASFNDTPWKASDYMAKLSGIPGLLDLVRNPFHLWMSLETLPTLVGGERDMSKVRVSRSELYDAFTKRSIDVAKRRQQRKSMNASELEVFETLLDDTFQSRVIGFLKDLAIDIFKEQEGNPVIRQTGSIDKHNWKAKLFGSNLEWTILREASPLTRAGKKYSFLHSSLLDYFYARAVFDPDVSEDDEASIYHQHFTADEQRSVGPILSQRILVEQTSILHFLAERAQQNNSFETRLLKMIEESKAPTYTSCTAANAMTILVQSGFRFNGRDLRGIRIQGADLTGGCFDNANFKGANLKDVTFFSAWLRQANFKGASMSGVRFGEGLYLEGSAMVLCCAYSPNGEYLVVSFNTGKIVVYDTKRWNKSTRTFVRHKDPVRRVAFSPKGAHIVSACDDATLCLWNFVTREADRVLEGHVGAVLDAAFSPKGTLVASAGSDRSIKLWDTGSGAAIYTIQEQHHWPVTCVAFSPNGRLLASGSEDAVFLWDPKTGKQAFPLDDNLTGASSVAFSSTGNRLAYGLEDGAIKVYNISSRPESGTLAEHSPPMTLREHPSRVSSLVFSQDGHQIISAGRDGSVRVCSAHNTVPAVILYNNSPKVHCVTTNPSGLQIASGGEDKTVRLWALNRGISRVSSNSHKRAVSYVTYSSDGKLVASVGQGGTAKIWDVEKGTTTRNFNTQQHDISPNNNNITHATTIALAPEGGYLAFARPERTIQVVSTKAGGGRGEVVTTLAGHTDDILCLAFSPYCNQLASGSQDKTVRIWDFRAKTVKLVLNDHSDKVTAIAFSPSGHNIATATGDGQVILWHGDTPTLQYKISLHSASITSLTYSTNERRLLTTSMDGSIREVDVNRGIKTHSFSGIAGHSKGVISAVYFDNDRKIASAGLDDLIRVWDVRSEHCLETVGGLVGPITTVAWKVVATTGAVLFVTGCEDKSVRQWKLVLDEKDVYRAKLDWTSNSARLIVLDTRVQGCPDL
ncbi:hypothetical protein BGW39_009290, partial [Mortierella sp. 14UC]